MVAALGGGVVFYGFKGGVGNGHYPDVSGEYAPMKGSCRSC